VWRKNDHSLVGGGPDGHVCPGRRLCARWWRRRATFRWCDISAADLGGRHAYGRRPAIRWRGFHGGFHQRFEGIGLGFYAALFMTMIIIPYGGYPSYVMRGRQQLFSGARLVHTRYGWRCPSEQILEP